MASWMAESHCAAASPSAGWLAPTLPMQGQTHTAAGCPEPQLEAQSLHTTRASLMFIPFCVLHGRSTAAQHRQASCRTGFWDDAVNVMCLTLASLRTDLLRRLLLERGQCSCCILSVSRIIQGVHGLLVPSACTPSTAYLQDHDMVKSIPVFVKTRHPESAAAANAKAFPYRKGVTARIVAVTNADLAVPREPALEDVLAMLRVQEQGLWTG